MAEDSKEQRIRKWLNKETAGPWMMEIHPTDRCNLSCQYCWRNAYSREEDELSNEKWKEIIEDAGKMGLRHLTVVGGGEPLLRIDLIKDLVKITKNYDIEGSLVTNGTLITSDFAKCLVENEWDGVAFSINGTIPSTDNFLRGNQNAFEMSLKGIKNINYWKKKLNKKKPVLTLHPAINKYNYTEVVKMIELSRELKMEIVLLRLVNYPNGQFSLEKNQAEEFALLLENAKLFARKYGIEFIQEFTKKELGLEQYSEKEKKDKREKGFWIHCPKPFFEIVITADGTTSVCCLICESRFSPKGPGESSNFLDNIKNKKLKDIWYGERFNFFRKSVLNSSPSQCVRFCTADQKFRINTNRLMDDRW